MIIDLFSDLDNTLIYSHRIKLKQDKVVAEMLDGKEQSYMTQRTLTFLQNTSQLRLIPVTTRSREQFERISLFPNKIACPYALICNGGELLVNGVPDLQWLEETKAMSAQAAYALQYVTVFMERIAARVYTPSGLMIYASFNQPAEVAQRLRAEVDSTVLDVLYDHRKVYCIPAAMNKGAAVRRFRERYRTEYVVTAGDSEFDLPLLNNGSLAITKRSLVEFVRNENTIGIDDNLILSDELSSALEKLLQQQN